MKVENYFRVFAILLPILAVATAGATLLYYYDVVFVGHIKAIKITLYDETGVQVSHMITDWNLSIGKNIFNWTIQNDGWYDANITAGITIQTVLPGITIKYVPLNLPTFLPKRMTTSVPFDFSFNVTAPTELPSDLSYELTFRVEAMNYD